MDVPSYPNKLLRMAKTQANSNTLKQLLSERILLLDGGMGTSLQSYDLAAKDFGGEKYEGCNDYLSITRPDIVGKIHEGFLKAGSDIIETNTFAASSITLSEFGLQDKEYEINKSAATLAKKIANKYSTLDKPRFVAGSIGPTNKTISVTGNITFEELELSYYRQAKALFEGGVDLFLFETIFYTLNSQTSLFSF